MTSFHKSYCPAQEEYSAATEVYPGLWIGSVKSRDDRRFGAVVSILTPGEMMYYRGVPLPRCPMYHVDHGDRVTGLLEKLDGMDAFGWVDKQRCLDHLPQNARGTAIGATATLNPIHVLFHCAQGASRSPTAFIAYAVSRGYGTLEDVTQRVITTRPVAMHLWERYGCVGDRTGGFGGELIDRFG